MRKISKFVAMAGLVVAMSSTSVAQAGDFITKFSIDVKTDTQSKSNYSLQKKQTSFYTTANTYKNGDVQSKKLNYTMYLFKDNMFAWTYAGSAHAANGKQFQTYFKSVKSGKYKYSIKTSQNTPTNSLKVSGKGELWQD